MAWFIESTAGYPGPPSAPQLDRKPCARGRILPGLDRAAMLRHDPADDRQTQPAAPALRGVVRHEELVTIRGGNTRPFVGEPQPREIVRRIVLCLESDRAAAAGRFDRIV